MRFAPRPGADDAAESVRLALASGGVGLMRWLSVLMIIGSLALTLLTVRALGLSE